MTHGVSVVSVLLEKDAIPHNIHNANEIIPGKTDCWPRVRQSERSSSQYRILSPPPSSKLSRSELSLQIRSYPNSSRYWARLDPLSWPKIPLTAVDRTSAASRICSEQYAVNLVTGTFITMIILSIYGPVRTSTYQPTAGLTSTCPQTDVKDVASLGVFCVITTSSPPSCFWLSRRGLQLQSSLQLTAPKEVTPVNYTSANDWEMAVPRDNIISIKLRQG